MWRSKVDAEQAYAVGKAAVEYALAGMNGGDAGDQTRVRRTVQWKIEPAPLTAIANVEKKLPRSFISADGFAITPAARRYLAPLIRGEDAPPYDAASGLPKYARLNLKLAKKKLPRYAIADK